MAEQLTFELDVRPSLKRGDFFVSAANALAVARLDAVPTWPLGKLVLVGPEGAGKTHLAHVWAEANHGVTGTVGGLLASDIPEVDTPCAIETQDHLGGFDPREEEALFHLHNHMAANGLPLLLIAQKPPSQWNVDLPDLKSRMEATDLVRIEAPDDDLLAAVLVKLFADRQISATPAAIAWMVTHMDRSFADAQDAVARIDAAALAEGRAITRDLAQEVLDKGP